MKFHHPQWLLWMFLKRLETASEKYVIAGESPSLVALGLFLPSGLIIPLVAPLANFPEPTALTLKFKVGGVEIPDLIDFIFPDPGKFTLNLFSMFDIDMPGWSGDLNTLPFWHNYGVKYGGETFFVEIGSTCGRSYDKFDLAVDAAFLKLLTYVVPILRSIGLTTYTKYVMAEFSTAITIEDPIEELQSSVDDITDEVVAEESGNIKLNVKDLKDSMIATPTVKQMLEELANMIGYKLSIL